MSEIDSLYHINIKIPLRKCGTLGKLRDYQFFLTMPGNNWCVLGMRDWLPGVTERSLLTYISVSTVTNLLECSSSSCDRFRQRQSISSMNMKVRLACWRACWNNSLMSLSSEKNTKIILLPSMFVVLHIVWISWRFCAWELPWWVNTEAVHLLLWLPNPGWEKVGRRHTVECTLELWGEGPGQLCLAGPRRPI